MLISLILKTIFGIVLVSFVARFLAQMARADFYNPLAQTVIKITDPFVKPLRRVLPSIGGLDTASLVALFAGQVVLAVLLYASFGGNPLEVSAELLIGGLISVAVLMLTVIQWSMIIVGISSFILMGQHNPFVDFIGQMIEPFVGPFRRLNIQIGMLDLSFLLAFFVIIVIKDVLILQYIGQYIGFSRYSVLFIGV